MNDILMTLINSLGLSGPVSGILLSVVLALIALLFAVSADFITRRVLGRLLKSVVKRTKTRWDDILLEKKVFIRISHIVPALVIYIFLPLIFASEDGLALFLQDCTVAYMIGIGTMVILTALGAVNDIYQTYDVAKNRPIKGYIQLIQVFAAIVGILLVITTILNKSPLGILSGIGAMTAILLLVFRDTILGLVSSVQIGANDLVRIGDWIEMPKYGADGDVVDVTLQTIKIQNWDKAITTIPIYALISDSFKNWRGMQESGGRRIKRSLNIDMRSIRFCDEEMLDRFKRISLLEGYIEARSGEITAFNMEQGIDTSTLGNGRRMTNIGTFRAYIAAYLHSIPKVDEGMTFMVRQLQSGAEGLPLEIYVFSNDQVWANYEELQADIFDHLFAVLPIFGLEIFQAPSGADFKNIARALEEK